MFGRRALISGNEGDDIILKRIKNIENQREN